MSQGTGTQGPTTQVRGLNLTGACPRRFPLVPDILTRQAHLAQRLLGALPPRLFPLDPTSASPLASITASRALRRTLHCSPIACCSALASRRGVVSAVGGWPVRHCALQGPFRLTRGWLRNTTSDSSSASRNSNASWGPGAPRYDAYIPLPAGVTEASSHPGGGSSGSDSDGNNGNRAPDADPFTPLPPPRAVTGWPPRTSDSGRQGTPATAGADAPSATSSGTAASVPDMVHGTGMDAAAAVTAAAASGAAAAAATTAAAAIAAAAGPDPFTRDLREVVAQLGGSAGDVSAEGKAAPAVDVTRHNFEVMLPAVRRYLSCCDFFSFDCEMTGLFLEGQTENYLDDMQDRYTRTAQAAQAFVINQFGLSCFKRQEGAGPGGERRYLAATFNFYLFPRPPEGSAAASSMASRRFVCDAGSLAFLANQGFDFNRCIYDGVPFVPVRQRDDMLRQLDRDNGGDGGGYAPRSDVVLSKQEDIAFVQGLIASVQEWLAGGAEEHLDLPPVNRYLRLLTYQALARPESFGGPPGGGNGWHPGFYVKKVYDDRTGTGIRLVRCATAAAAAELEAADRRARRGAVAAAAGFAAVWEALRDCGRPAVGHNCMFDVAYGIAQFGEGRLPATWQGFKSSVASWFPGGLYDTKHICRQLPEVLGSDTSLGAVYRALLQQPEAAAATSAAAPPWLPAGPPSPALPARVSVSHAPGFEKYAAVAAGQLAHEAGYDAFMTGSVFVGLEAVMADRANGAAAAPGPSTSPSPPPPYAAVVPYIWRLNVTRSDMPYAVLRPAVPGDPSSQDPVPERPQVVYLSCLGPGVRAGDIHRCCEEAGLGKVRITFQPGNNALLELESAGAAEAAVGGALAHSGLCGEVLRYTAFRQRKDALLATGAWPLPGHVGPRGTWAAGGAGAPPAGNGTGRAPAPAAAAAVGDAAAAARPAKRARVEVEEEEARAQEGPKEERGRGQCAIM